MAEKYEQMEFDVREEAERELREKIDLAISSTLSTIRENEERPIGSREEGYGTLAAIYAALVREMKHVKADIGTYLGILDTDDQKAIEASNALLGSAKEVAYEAIRLAANADRVMNDLYRNSSHVSPLEAYADQQEDGFDEAPEEGTITDGIMNDSEDEE